MIYFQKVLHFSGVTMGPTKYIPQSARLIQNLSLKTVIGEMKNKSPQMSVVIPVEYFLQA